MTLDGRAIAGSSRAPARTIIKLGRPTSWLKSGVPHVVQKRRRIMFPLSDRLQYSLVFPVSRRPSVAKTALIEALPEERYWQSLHQQAREKIGGLSN